MRQSTKLILNTGATYVRMAITVGIGLVSTAIALRALGESDLGVYGAMLAAAGLGMIASDSLAFSAQRQMSLAIGKKDDHELRRVLATVMSVVLLLGALPMGASLLLGHSIVSVLDVPEARHSAAWWALQWCMATFAVQLFSSPFKSLLLAHQDIITLTLVEIGESVFRLGAALAVLWGAPGDKLVMYAALCAGGTGLSTLVLGGMCARLHPVSRVRPGAVHMSELRELTRIAGWDVLLQALWRVRTQGGQILLNVAFGPVVNSANTIANQAAGYQNNLAYSITRASHPAIIGAEAAKLRQRVHQLVLCSSKYMLLVMLFLLVPLFLQTESMLRLWLGTYPHATPEILRLTALWIALNYSAAGHVSAMYATGKMARVTASLGVVDALALAMAAWLIFWLKAPPWTLAAVFVGATFVGSLIRAIMIGSQIELPATRWLRETILPVVAIAAAATFLGWGAMAIVGPQLTGVASHLTDQPPERLVALFEVSVVVMTTVAVVPPLSWMLALAKEEREHFRRVASAILNRFTRRAHAAS